jgi:hypothetical protein
MTGELHRGADLSDIAHGFQAAGSFQFDEATMRKLVKDWLDLADSYEASRRAARQMMLVEGPGLDFASHAYAEAASSSGEAYHQYLVKNRDYCHEQAQLFQKALDDYLGIEHTNVTGMDSQGSQPGII